MARLTRRAAALLGCSLIFAFVTACGSGTAPKLTESTAPASAAATPAAEYPAVVRTVYLVLHDYSRSEEIAQDAFVQLLRHWNKVRRYEAPGAWVRRVAIRLATRDAKREQRRVVLARKSIVQDRVEPSPAASMDPDLTAAIRSLPAQQRAVVVLFYFEDRPMEEIAEITGCSVSTGWVHLHRARKRLGTLLSEEVTNDVG